MLSCTNCKSFDLKVEFLEVPFAEDTQYLICKKCNVYIKELTQEELMKGIVLTEEIEI